MTRRYFNSLTIAVSLTLAVLAGTVYAAEKEFRFEGAVKAYEQASAENPPTAEHTFFVGSSTFTGWKNIPNDFAEFNAVNRGFGGSTFTDWNDIATARLLAPYKPARIVLYCGTNDLSGGVAPDVVLERFKTFLDDVRKLNPDVKIHFCAVHDAPVREKVWDANKAYNEAVKKMAEEDPNLYYVDFNAAVRDDEGKVREELYRADRLHFTREAEQLLVPFIVESIRKEIADSEKN